MPKGKNALLAAFGSPKAGEPEGDGYADEEKAALYEQAFGTPATPEQLEAFKELVHLCVEAD